MKPLKGFWSFDEVTSSFGALLELVTIHPGSTLRSRGLSVCQVNRGNITVAANFSGMSERQRLRTYSATIVWTCRSQSVDGQSTSWLPSKKRLQVME